MSWLTEGEPLARVDALEEGASGEERRDEVDAVVRLDDAVYFDYVGVIQCF